MKMRSPDGRDASWAWLLASRSLDGSMSNPSSWAIRASRSSRSGSSANTPSDTVRKQAPIEIVAASEWIDEIAVVQGDSDRVDGEIAQAEIVLDAASAPGDVDRLLARHHAPGTVSLRQRKRRAPAATGQPLRHRARILGDDQVDVEHRPAQQHVAHAAADQPGALHRCPPADICERVSRRR